MEAGTGEVAGALSRRGLCPTSSVRGVRRSHCRGGQGAALQDPGLPGLTAWRLRHHPPGSDRLPKSCCRFPQVGTEDSSSLRRGFLRS